MGPTRQRYTRRRLGADLVELLDGARHRSGSPPRPLTRWALVLDLALDLPRHRVASLLAVDTAAATVAEIDLASTEKLADHGRRVGMAEVVVEMIKGLDEADGPPLLSPQRREAMIYTLGHVDPEALSALADELNHYDVVGRLGELTSPTTVIVGSEDHLRAPPTSWPRASRRPARGARRGRPQSAASRPAAGSGRRSPTICSGRRAKAPNAGRPVTQPSDGADDMGSSNTDRTVLVTGANSGIGLADRARGGPAGFRAVGSVRSRAKAEVVAQAAAEAGVDVETVLLDVTDADALRARSSADLDLYGLVNNAGYTVTGAIEDVDDDEARRQLETMVVAPMRLARLALPAMRAARRGSHRQRLVDLRPHDDAAHRAGTRRPSTRSRRLSDALRMEVARRRREGRAGRAGRVQDRHLGGASSATSPTASGSRFDGATGARCS